MTVCLHEYYTIQATVIIAVSVTYINNSVLHNIVSYIVEKRKN